MQIMKTQCNIVQLAQSKLIRFILTGDVQSGTILKLKGNQAETNNQMKNNSNKNISYHLNNAGKNKNNTLGSKVALDFGKKLLFTGIP